MPTNMVGETLKSNVKERGSAVKTRVTDQISIAKSFVADIKRLLHGEQAQLPSEVHFPGTRHGWADLIPSALIATSDAGQKHRQRQIEITRRGRF